MDATGDLSRGAQGSSSIDAADGSTGCENPILKSHAPDVAPVGRHATGSSRGTEGSNNIDAADGPIGCERAGSRPLDVDPSDLSRYI